jgi:hypothetical protein
MPYFTKSLVCAQHHEQSSSCQVPEQQSCIRSWADKEPYLDRYIAFVENFTIGLQHGFTISNHNKVQSYRAQSMSGQLNQGTSNDADAVDVSVHFFECSGHHPTSFLQL